MRLYPSRLLAVALIAGSGLLASCHAQTASNSQMLLGNPDGAKAAASQKQHYLIARPQYALSYNDKLRFPNWVAWHLSASDMGSAKRGAFAPDTSLPAGFKVVRPSDYSNSGYDKGHNCPSADRTASRADNDAVFLMTNMTPQMHAMNAGPWENLESYCRDLAKAGNELYIVCGHGFNKPSDPATTIGKAGVAVPDFGWKVVLVLPERSGDDLKRITASTRVIAVKVPNTDGIQSAPWTDYVTTPAAIEKATGLKLFTAVPAAVAKTLRVRKDSGKP